MDLTHLPPIRTADRSRFKLGANRNPNGVEIAVDSRSLLLNGRHWMPVMGEMQYSRCHRSGWRDGLLKMKAGGIDIVATYVFWIHHEEVEGEFDFTAQRSLREFALLCRETGLHLQVRCGPWDHGECRNGGFPDWLLRKGYFTEVPTEAKQEGAPAAPREGIALRSDDPGYLALVARLYGEIAAQLRGLLWEDGGPVIGIQVENEYSGPAEHLLTLKRMAREAGLDVPLYTFTGWPKPKTPMPFGELLPLYGVYAEGMWDRTIEQMPGGYWGAFKFAQFRIEGTIATDHFGVRANEESPEVYAYPYLTCELGGGMPPSYHRRVRWFTGDSVAPALVRLGSGNSLPGYYVFHGGTNPDGRLSFLNESQATGYPNDLTVKSYDFQAPLGEFGQVREHYRWLRRMHLFLHEFGEQLAEMTPVFAGGEPAGKEDTETLRWCVRGNETSALIFCNNYQRLQPMPPKQNVQFTLRLKCGEVSVPSRPATIAADSFFTWPVNIDLGGVTLTYATAEMLCSLEVGDTKYWFFSEAAGVRAEFAFDGEEVTSNGEMTAEGRRVYVNAKPGTDVAIRVRTKDGKKICIVLLDMETSLTCWKCEFGGRERVLLSEAVLLPEKDNLRCQMAGDSSVAIFPPVATVGIDGVEVQAQKDGIFGRFDLAATAVALDVSVEKIKEARPARTVPIGPYGVAEAPPEEEFERAAVWRVKLPAKLDASRGVLLRFHYLGDVARIYLDDRLLTDNFYNGLPFEVALTPFAPEIFSGELLFKVLPLRPDAPIYLLPESRPANISPEGIADLRSVELIATTERRIIKA